MLSKRRTSNWADSASTVTWRSCSLTALNSLQTTKHDTVEFIREIDAELSASTALRTWWGRIWCSWISSTLRLIFGPTLAAPTPLREDCHENEGQCFAKDWHWGILYAIDRFHDLRFDLSWDFVDERRVPWSNFRQQLSTFTTFYGDLHSCYNVKHSKGRSNFNNMY